MANTGMLHVRIDEQLKARGNAVLEAIGLTAAEAIRLFYHRVIAEQGLPLELKVPNAQTQRAMREAEEIAARRKARFTDANGLLATLEAADLEVRKEA